MDSDWGVLSWAKFNTEIRSELLLDQKYRPCFLLLKLHLCRWKMMCNQGQRRGHREEEEMDGTRWDKRKQQDNRWGEWITWMADQLGSDWRRPGDSLMVVLDFTIESVRKFVLWGRFWDLWLLSHKHVLLVMAMGVKSFGRLKKSLY